MSDDDRSGGASKRPRVELNLDAPTAQGRYANATVVTHGRHEVVLDFVAALPHHRPQVVSRVVLPRAQAEALAQTLRRTLDASPGGGPAGGAPGVPTPRGDDDPN